MKLLSLAAGFFLLLILTLAPFGIRGVLSGEALPTLSQSATMEGSPNPSREAEPSTVLFTDAPLVASALGTEEEPSTPPEPPLPGAEGESPSPEVIPTPPVESGPPWPILEGSMMLPSPGELGPGPTEEPAPQRWIWVWGEDGMEAVLLPQAILGTITGTVVYTSGLPAAGVQVYRDLYDAGGVFTQTTTDAQGVYTATVPSLGLWVVGARSQSYTLESTRVVSVTSSGQTVVGIDLTLLQNSAVITGSIKDQYGVPVSGAGAHALDWSTGWPLTPDAAVDASGLYTLGIAAGTWRVNTKGLPGYARTVDQRISVAAGATVTGVNFLLQRLDATITGTVRDQSAVPLAGASVGTGDPYWGTSTTTDASGLYTLTVYAGTWGVWARKDGYLQEASDPVTVTENEVRAGINFTLTQGNAWIVGSVRLQDGTVLTNRWVWANRYQGKGNSGTNSDANGVYTMSVTAGDWYVVTRLRGYTLQSTPLVALSQGQTITGTDLTLLDNNATVTGTVRDQHNNPISGASVSLRDGVTNHWLSEEVTTNASGVYTLPVPAGTWYINAQKTGYISPSNQQVDPVAQGQTISKDLALQVLNSSISGQVKDDSGNAISGAQVWTWNPKQEAGWTSPPNVTSDASGFYTISVYAATWNLNAWKAGHTLHRDLQVTVGDGEQRTGVAIILPRGTAEIRGTVAITGGIPVQNAWVEAWKQKSDERSDNRNRMDATGFYSLAVTSGDWVVFANLGGYTVQRAPLVSVGSGQVITQDLTLITNTAILSGTIRDQDSLPVPNAHVTIYDVNTGGRLIPWSLGFADSLGRYGLGVAPGTWKIQVQRDGYEPPCARTFSIAGGETKVIDLVMGGPRATIKGNLRDASGNPILQADVSVWSNPYTGCGGLGSVTTDATGAYTLTLPSGTRRISAASLSGYLSPSSHTVIVRDGETLLGVDFVYWPTNSTILGSIGDDIGNPLSGVRVDASRSQGGSVYTTTDASGLYTLPVSAGNWSIRPSTEITGYTRPRTQNLLVGSNQTVRAVNFAYLANTATIAGLIRDDAGSPLSSPATLTTSRSDGASVASISITSTFLLTVAPGIWNLSAGTLEGYTAPPSQNVRVGPGETATTADFIYLANTATVRGTVRDGAGNLASGISLSGSTNLSNGGSVPSVSTDASGAYTLTLSAGHWAVGTRSALGGSTTPTPRGITVGSNQTVTGFDFTYNANTSFITGTVKDGDGNPLVGVSLSASMVGLGNGVAGVTTNAEGAYRIAVSPGTWNVSVSGQVLGYSRPPAKVVMVGEGQTVRGIDFTLRPNQHTISGRVTVVGSPLAGISVSVGSAQLSGPPSVSTDANGYYTLTMPTGIWGVSPGTMLSGYTRPPGKTVVISGTVSGIDFDYVANERTISGRVVAGSARAGAWVSASRSDGASVPSITTDASGRYTIPVSSGIWNVSPGSNIGSNYTRPASQSVDVSTTSKSGVDFTYATNTSTISGRVKDSAGNGIPGVWVNASATLSGHGSVPRVTTDASGAYTFTLSAGSWSIGADTVLGGHTAPAGRSLTLGENETLTGIDLVYTINTSFISGIVTVDGIPVADVTVYPSVRPGPPASPGAFTDRQGSFTLSVAGTALVCANTDLVGSTRPPCRLVALGENQRVSDVRLNYASNAYTLSGSVRDSSGNPLSGVYVYASNQSGVSAPSVSTRGNGSYSLGVSSGQWTVGVSTDLAGLVRPPEQSVVVTSSKSIDFVYPAASSRISGRVTDDAGSPLAGVRVSASRHFSGYRYWAPSISTDSSGNYSLAVTEGIWSVSATREITGHVTPEAQLITVGAAQSLTGVDFVYARATGSISGQVSSAQGAVSEAVMVGSRFQGGRAAYPIYTGASGSYTLAISAGTYEVWAGKAGYIPPPFTYTTASSGQVITGVNFTLGQPSGSIAGTVRDPEGNPIQGACLLLLDRHGKALAWRIDRPTLSLCTNPAGNFQMGVDLRSDAYRLVAFKQGYEPRGELLYYTQGENVQSALTLRPQGWATLQGKVTSGGLAVPNALVVLRRPDGDIVLSQSGSWLGAATNADGDYVFTAPIMPGDYVLLVSVMGYQEASATVSLAAGQNATANVSLTPLATIPTYGVSYLGVGLTTTVLVSETFAAQVVMKNNGSATWTAGGANPMGLGYLWLNNMGQSVATGTVSLRYDVPSSGVLPVRTVAAFQTRLQAPALDGTYALRLGLRQGDSWLGATRDITMTVRSPITETVGDLLIAPMSVWIDPASVYESDLVEVGVSVHYVSRWAQAASDVEVRFYDGDPTAGGTLIGGQTYSITMIAPNGSARVQTGKVWNTAGLGGQQRTLYIIVDPNNRFTELTKANNVKTRTVYVKRRVQVTDTIAPTGTLSINNGAETTASQQVTLTLNAQDNPGGTGVRWMHITEFAFDYSERRWEPAQQSGWVRYTTTSTWTLLSGGGVKHLAARFADGAGNVSNLPARASILYIPPCERVGSGQWRLYQVPIEAGTLVTITVTPCTADPDLYVWVPGNRLEPDFYSTNAGVAADTVTFLAPYSGTYQIQVYGFDVDNAYNYSITRRTLEPAQRVPQAGTRQLGEGKTVYMPSEPLTTDDPYVYVPEQTPAYYTYLPILMRAYPGGW